MLKVVRAKFHGIRVTGADLHYHGSVTLDPELCALAGIYPLEFVEIWNKNSGARISTYVIFGEPGSRCCILNGAAARTCQIGDEVVIAAPEYTTPDQLYELDPKILTFLPDNRVDQILRYNVFKGEEREHDFQIINPENAREESTHVYTNVDVTAIRQELKDKGWSEVDIETFVEKHLSL